MAKVASQLGPGGLSLLVDHPDQLEYVEAVGRLSAIGGDGMPVAPVVFIKIDAGYHRAGIWLDERVSSDGSSPGEARLDNVLRRLLDGEARGLCTLHGLYVHAGQSYDARGDAKGINSLLVEIKTLIHATRAVMRCISTGSTSSDSTGGSSRPRHLVLSAGSSPSVSQLVHIAVTDRRDPQDDVQNAALEVRSHIALIAAGIEGAATTLEMHAGVYPLQDLQQLATRALASPDSPGCMSYKDMALTILGEVASVYPNRGPGGHTDEALVTAGSLALGREPVKVVRRTHIGDGGHGIDPDHHYASWGIVMPWAAEGSDMNGQPPPDKWFPFRYKGWQVVRISQEHGILGWAGGAPAAGEAPALRVGQTVRIWPNHACIAGAGFDHYLVVDGGDRVVDVWPRWNGW